MKRGAERQIQREDGDDPHSLEGDSEGASSIDSETRSIASRPIRGLPKKKTGSTPSSPAQTLSSSPLNSTNPAMSQSSATSSPSTFTSAGSPAFSGFASTPKASSSSNFTTNSAPFSFSTPVVNGNASKENAKEEVDYYCSLRGLNMSLKNQLLEAISKEVEKDPFTNLSNLLQHVEGKYTSMRRETEERRSKTLIQTSVPALSTSVPSSSALSKAAPTSSSTLTSSNLVADIPSASKSNLSPAAPSFAPPKVHIGGGFTFAGSSFSAPTSASNSTASRSLLPGQPTFLIPKTGFYSSFGKVNNDDEDEEEVQVGDRDDKIVQAKENDIASTSTSVLASQTSQGAFTGPTLGALSNAKPKSFNFGSPSSTPFSFGSATAAAAPSTINNDNSSDKQYRFSFGTSNPSARISEGEKSTDDSNSSISSPAKAPSIGSNFANTSGVKQGGAFSFGSSRINFGNSSTSNFGNTSTSFTFGSSPSKDNNAKNESK